jgi:hypothetical protein
MPDILTPKIMQQALLEGINRKHRYLRQRAMYIKDYVGQYYSSVAGLTGDQPINMIFVTLRALIPNLVQKNPTNKVITEIVPFIPYAELLGYSLDKLQKTIKMKKILRGGIVDSVFGFAIFKTALKASGLTLTIDDVDVDPGQIYTDNVDLDDFVFDPLCKKLDKATWMGHRVRVRRQQLLNDPDFNEVLVRALPSAKNEQNRDRRASALTTRSTAAMAQYQLMDYVNVYEVWVPEANAIIYMPDPKEVTFEQFLATKDYYGPKTGPYTILSLTPPVPDNPFPVAPVGIWRDLNDMANRLMRKLLNQADRQKDGVLYKPAYADVAQAMIDDMDGFTIACDDPTAVVTVSMGGTNQDNERAIQQVSFWYNLIAGNPQQMAGLQTGAETATGQEILQANASITIEDARDIISDCMGDISAKQAWYLHHDPLVEMPLTKRSTGGEMIQLWLTPEQRMGSWLDYTFRIVKRSMQSLDPAIRTKRIMDFCTNVLPAAVMAAQGMLQMGYPFNLETHLTEIASELDIMEWYVKVFNDPELKERILLYAMLGPKRTGKAGGGGGGGTTMVSPEAIMQNGGSPSTVNNPTPQTMSNQNAQAGANASQSARRSYA